MRRYSEAQGFRRRPPRHDVRAHPSKPDERGYAVKLFLPGRGPSIHGAARLDIKRGDSIVLLTRPGLG